MTSTTKVLIDARAGTNLLYLPLDKLIQMSGVAGAPDLPLAAPGGSAAGTAPPPSLDTSPRSRDTLRGRDREGRP